MSKKYIMESFPSTKDEGRGDINITVWAELPKIEIYSSRGQSFIVRDADAVKFAEWLRDNVVAPVLATPELELMADGVFARPEPGGLFNVEPDPRAKGNKDK